VELLGEEVSYEHIRVIRDIYERENCESEDIRKRHRGLPY